jgi:hypothetical protein
LDVIKPPPPPETPWLIREVARLAEKIGNLKREIENLRRELVIARIKWSFRNRRSAHEDE